MIDQKHDAPRRYFVDAQGHRVLIGLSFEETAEFEALDPSSKETVHSAADIRGGEWATAAGEIRWLELLFQARRCLADVDRTKPGSADAGFKLC